MTCGIYKITENETGRCYIGQSRNIEGRWARHRKEKYPPNLFNYEIVTECDAEQLDFWEIAWIASERSIEFGFNRKIGGKNWDMFFSDETRIKLSKAGKKADHSRCGGGPGSRAGALSQLATGKHNFQVKVTCPKCGDSGSGAFKRWHFDNCKPFDERSDSYKARRRLS